MRRILTTVAAVLTLAATAASASAARYDSSLWLLPAVTPHHGDSITFGWSTDYAGNNLFIGLQCSQDGVPVYATGALNIVHYGSPGWYLLASAAWTSGPADCTARMYYLAPPGYSRSRTLATLDFRVEA